MTREFPTFWVQDSHCGVDILLVREIIQPTHITPVQRAAPAVRGLVNLRGQIVTIIDLRVCLGMPARAIDASSHIVILKREDELLPVRQRTGRPHLRTSIDSAGLLVDAIGDIVTVEDDQIAPVPANLEVVEQRFIEGVLKLPENLLMLLSVGALLRDAHHREDRARRTSAAPR